MSAPSAARLTIGADELGCRALDPIGELSVRSWKNWAEALRQNTHALYLAGKDPRVPILAKFVVVIVVAYALSPIDLIPDFIPIVGYVDDLLLLPIGIWIAVRLIPDEIWQDCRERARRSNQRVVISRIFLKSFSP